MGLLLLCNGLEAQSICRDVVAASGHRQQTPSYSLAWTVGETAVQYQLAGNKALGEGFHRSSICPTIVSAPEAPYPNFKECISVVKNPFGNSLRLLAECGEMGQCDYVLRDINGRIVKAGQFELQQRDLRIDASHLPQGIYLLVLGNSQAAFHQQFKLVKTL